MLPARRENYEREYRDYARPETIERAELVQRPANKHVGLGRQLFLVTFILSVALVGLALVGSHERVALTHQENVKLKDRISEAKTYIEDLTVELEYSMDFNSVKNIASKRFGMDYPRPDQLVKVAPPVLPLKSAQPEAAPEDGEHEAAEVEPEPSFEPPEVERTFNDEDAEIIDDIIG